MGANELRVDRLENDVTAIYDLITDVHATQRDHTAQLRRIEKRQSSMAERQDSMDTKLQDIATGQDTMAERQDTMDSKLDVILSRLPG